MDVVSAKAASKGLEIIFWNKDGDEANDWILGDSTRFRQIVINCKWKGGCIYGRCTILTLILCFVYYNSTKQCSQVSVFSIYCLLRRAFTNISFTPDSLTKVKL
jgi:hypothetical protein